MRRLCYNFYKIRLEILWAVFAKTQIKSLSTDGQTTESKVKQESEEKNDKDKRAETWTNGKAIMRRP